MEKLKVSQIAQSLRVSNQTIYNYLAKFRQELDGNLIRENGKQYLTQDGFKILKNCLGKPEPIEVVKGSQNLESLIVGLKETIDTLIAQHAEERARSAEERQRSDTIIMKLSNDLGSVRNLLEETKKPIAILSTPPKPVKPWEPVRVQVVKMPWYEKLWCQMFNPEVLRESVE